MNPNMGIMSEENDVLLWKREREIGGRGSEREREREKERERKRERERDQAAFTVLKVSIFPNP